MKLSSLLLGLLCAFSLILPAVAADAEAGKKKEKKPKLRHVVCFKFEDSASKDDIKKVEEAFGKLKKKIPQIASYEWGLNNSPEGKNRGCTHGFMLTFRTEKDRDEYLPHPAHKEFGKLVGPLLDEVFVIDFWAKD